VVVICHCTEGTAADVISDQTLHAISLVSVFKLFGRQILKMSQ